MKEFEATLLRLAEWRPPWWWWPTALVVLGAGAYVASLLFAPGAGEMVTFLGTERGATCTFLELTGMPCPSCGMTRSWVHSARGHLLTGLSYNPAGAVLFWWLVAGGLIGAVRLALRDPKRLAVSQNALFLGALFWMIGLYTAFWVLRLAGFFPLPAG